MSNTRTFDPASIAFESTVYPTEADMKLWNSLTPEQQRAVVDHNLDKAQKSGIADPESFDARFARALERAGHGNSSQS